VTGSALLIIGSPSLDCKLDWTRRSADQFVAVLLLPLSRRRTLQACVELEESTKTEESQDKLCHIALERAVTAVI
jgi:hypothetical protein